jgi:hypothetical protein
MDKGVRSLEKTGRRETARRLRGAIGTIFRRAITTLRATNDPTYALRGALRPPTVSCCLQFAPRSNRYPRAP